MGTKNRMDAMGEGGAGYDCMLHHLLCVEENHPAPPHPTKYQNKCRVQSQMGDKRIFEIIEEVSEWFAFKE